jgi:hypothetical protein
LNIGRKIPDIGITLGDPAGIGPEVALRALGGIDSTKIRPGKLPGPWRWSRFSGKYPGFY